MSESQSGPAGPSFTRSRKLVVLVDMTNALRVLSGMSEIEYATFLDDFYDACTRHLEANGGSIVKYMGDSALAVFDEDAVVDAVDAVQSLRREFQDTCRKLGKESDVHCNMHAGDVVLGDFGPQGFRDVMGSTVSTTFTLDRGRGIHVSERVYRKLPNARRSGWQRHKPPVTYTLEELS
ncbi:MAG: adenylate/guanylate cyclase domain-containing protein [Gammaproteobacteria bacterium]|jgi:class 3 adenylate cyclase